MKPVRRLCYMFLWALKCTTFKSIPFILIVLTNKNAALIYSVTICQQKQRIVHFQGAFNINCSTVVFIIDVCHFSCSPLITMEGSITLSSEYKAIRFPKIYLLDRDLSGG